MPRFRLPGRKGETEVMSTEVVRSDVPRGTSPTARRKRRYSASSIQVVPSLSIHLLGGFRVTVSSRTIGASEWPLRKAKTLVKLLALAPDHRMHRLQIMDL